MLGLNTRCRRSAIFQTPMRSWVCFMATGTKLVTAHSASRGGAGKARARRQELSLRRLDSWAYEDQISEQTLTRNADMAASLGVELFVVDLGWARAIGDWYADPAKFPHGLSAVSDYVHSLGMKFGLHFALTRRTPPALCSRPTRIGRPRKATVISAPALCVSPISPRATGSSRKASALSTNTMSTGCLQDGQNMVKQCTKTTHTHDPNDSNYANAVDGLNAVVSAIQAARPNVSWRTARTAAA